MTRIHSLKTASLVAITAAATALLIQACGGGKAGPRRDSAMFPSPATSTRPRRVALVPEFLGLGTTPSACGAGAA